MNAESKQLIITLLKNLFSAGLRPQTLGVFAFNYMKYIDKLKNPKWQKKRLEILNRDEFKCCYCNDTETELQIHHLKYTKFRLKVNGLTINNIIELNNGRK